jgi:Protein of unknown function (DUF998)
LKPREVMASRLGAAAPVAGLAAPAVKAAAVVIVALHNPAYSPVGMSTSILEIMPWGWLSRLGSIILSLLVTIFFLGLSASVLRGRRLRLYAALTLPLFWILSAVFTDDPAGVSHSVHGVIHGIAGLGIALSFTSICFLFAGAFRGERRWSGFDAYSLAAGCLETTVLIVRAFLPYYLNWFGLYELILLANGAVWFEAVGIRYLLIDRASHSARGRGNNLLTGEAGLH